jgi:hypothetical protein
MIYKVYTRHSQLKSLARPLLKQAKFCPEKPTFSRKNVEGSGLVLEHVGTTQRYTLLKAKSLSLRMKTRFGVTGYIK